MQYVLVEMDSPKPDGKQLQTRGRVGNGTACIGPSCLPSGCKREVFWTAISPNVSAPPEAHSLSLLTSKAYP